MSTDDRIVLTPAKSATHVAELNDAALRYVTINNHKVQGSDAQRLEPTVNTVTLFDDFAEDPTKVRNISIPVTMRRVRNGDVSVSAAECRGLGVRDRICPRIRLVSYHDGRPVESYRIRYQRTLPIPEEGAGIFISAAMIVQPGCLYTISVIDRRTKARSTLIYQFDKFVGWPTDVKDKHGKPIRLTDYGLAESTLVAAIVTDRYGSVSHWISDAYTKRRDVIDRINATCDKAHSARDVRAYRRYFGRFPDSLAVIPLNEDDEHAPEAIQIPSDDKSIVNDIIDGAFDLMRNKVFPTYPEDAATIRDLQRNVPVGVVMTASDDGTVAFQATLNAGDHLKVYTAQLSGAPSESDYTAPLFGGKDVLTDLHKAVTDNGGMMIIKSVVTF